jgi:hypothetical protein
LALAQAVIVSLADDLRGFSEHMVKLVRDEAGIMPALHLQLPWAEGPDPTAIPSPEDTAPMTLPLDPMLFQDSGRELLVGLVTQVVAGYRPSEVGWTFLAWQHGSGRYEHEAVVVVVVDAESAEVWQARLVRHDGIASLGAWRRWPARAAQSAHLIQPVQEQLRQ